MEDDFLRQCLILFLQRLRQIEKDRVGDLPLLMATVLTVRKLSADIDRQFKAELQNFEEKKASGPVRDLSDIYDEAIRLLETPGPLGQDQQEKIRRLLESFEGPLQ